MSSASSIDLLARLAPAEPCWLFPGRRNERASEEVAAAFLEQLPEEDGQIVLLVHGFGLDLGSVAFALHLDPSIVSWRLRRSLLDGKANVEPAVLERGVAEYLRATAPGHDRSTGTTRAALLFPTLPEAVRERLDNRLASRDGDISDQERRPGLGVGSLVLILVSAAAFMVYGAIRDVNPLWRGMSLVRQGQFESARDAFQDLGDLAEGRTWIAITLLAEGDYEHALIILAEPGVAQFLGNFRPVNGPLEPLHAEGGSRALLPRGLTSETRPEFVYLSGPAGMLEIDLLVPGQPGRTRKVSWPVPDTSAGPPVTSLAYPETWPPLKDGVVVWKVQGDDGAPTSFTLLAREARQEMQQRAAAGLTYEIPQAAREFLRAHFDLRNGLYSQAARRFASLARQFPAQEYPQSMLSQVCGALGVDPQVFLR